LPVKHTFAGMPGNPFEMRYSAIKRDSHLPNGGRERDSRCDVGDAFAHLIAGKALRAARKRSALRPKGPTCPIPPPGTQRQARAAQEPTHKPGTPPRVPRLSAPL